MAEYSKDLRRKEEEERKRTHSSEETKEIMKARIQYLSLVYGEENVKEAIKKVRLAKGTNRNYVLFKESWTWKGLTTSTRYPAWVVRIEGDETRWYLAHNIGGVFGIHISDNLVSSLPVGTKKKVLLTPQYQFPVWIINRVRKNIFFF